MTSVVSVLDPLDSAFTAAELMDRQYPPLEYVVSGIIPEGLTVLVAPPKIGKSWMVLGIAKAVSEGGQAFGAIPVSQRPVLYLALEDGPMRLQNRLHALGMVEGNENLWLMTALRAGAARTIRAFVEEHHQQAPLVILDTLGMVRSIYAGNDPYQKDYAEMSGFKELVSSHIGASLIVVHHTNKGAHSDFVSNTSGTQGIAGAADSILAIERARGDGGATLNVTSRDAAEGAYAITLDDGQWRLEGEDLSRSADLVQTQKSTRGLGADMTQVIEFVSNYPEGVTLKQVEDGIGASIPNIRAYLKRAVDNERLQRLSRGIYAPISVTTVTSVTTPQNQSG